MTTAVKIFDVPRRRLLFARLAKRAPRGGFSHPFGGPPSYRCPNSACPKSRANGSMRVFLPRDHKLGAGVTLPAGIGDWTRLYFLKCPSCHAVVASHEGT